MLPHHLQTVQNITAHLRADPRVLALILGGSVTHGYAIPSSDIDVMIVLSPEDHAAQLATGYATYRNVECADYPDGYVDGKFTTLDFIRTVAERGSEPARYAFSHAHILFSDIPELEELVKKAGSYPVHLKKERLQSFRVQFAAWHWFSTEARKKGNVFLVSLAVSKMCLFGIRLVLAWNEMLYPFHKWALKELEKAGEKPEGMVQAIERACKEMSEEHVEGVFELIKNFREWEEGMKPDGWDRWGTVFLKDVELTWLNGQMAIDDV
ncbi:hypothetical protein QBC34DRAFT_485356 [Podospora aff. communis PSN243]|uniref:Polymerase nucleotidyl transferase domain-containing protein n=1 Tax=Podospora aff. communis PSN243 TaxID=3040156 RepID=A0AAV9GLZ2_9PEZI|nr:hypothetical protein QBC34DRAFT_485356 [Podospora aff. communis PSN243]